VLTARRIRAAPLRAARRALELVAGIRPSGGALLDARKTDSDAQPRYGFPTGGLACPSFERSCRRFQGPGARNVRQIKIALET
jgi:hypothetical protein